VSRSRIVEKRSSGMAVSGRGTALVDYSKLERKGMMKASRFLIVLTIGLFWLAACQPVTAGVLVETGGESAQEKESLDMVSSAPRRVPGPYYSYSGDDAYDPAAGGLGIELQLPVSINEKPALRSGGYNGDDVYDPAAGGLSIGQKQPVTDMEKDFFNKGSYSGDDPYDPAAGGLSLDR